VVERSRGSTSAPGVLAECLRVGSGPTAILLAEPDTTVLVAARLASELYGIETPIVILGPEDHASIEPGALVTVEAKGAVNGLDCATGARTTRVTVLYASPNSC